MRDHRVGELARQRGKPVAVGQRRHPDRISDQLPFGEPVGVLAAARDQRVDQRVPVLGVDAGHIADRITRVTHGPQQRDRAGRGVQPHRVADAGVLGGVCREHHRDPLLGGRNRPQPGVFDGQPGDPGAALRIGDVGDQTLVVDLFERERNRDDAAVELRHRDLAGDVERRETVVVVLPLREGTRQAQALQDRDVQRGQLGHVPAVVVTAGGDGGRDGGARGQHRGHHRVGGGEQVQQPGFGSAQRSAEHRQRPPAGILDGTAQLLDVAGVAGQVLGAVVEHRDRRAVAVAGSPVEDAPGRRGHRRPEPEAGHQQRVAEEGVQLPQVW